MFIDIADRDKEKKEAVKWEVGKGEELKKIVCGGCGGHCPAMVRVRDGKIVEQFFQKNEDMPFPMPFQDIMDTINKSCGRAQSAVELIDHPQRINYPLKRAGQRGENKWQRVTWDEALDDIADKLQKVKDEYGPEGVAFCTVGENNTSEEYERRFMNLFGSPTFACQGQI